MASFLIEETSPMFLKTLIMNIARTGWVLVIDVIVLLKFKPLLLLLLVLLGAIMVRWTFSTLLLLNLSFSYIHTEISSTILHFRQGNIRNFELLKVHL